MVDVSKLSAGTLESWKATGPIVMTAHQSSKIMEHHKMSEFIDDDENLQIYWLQ